VQTERPKPSWAALKAATRRKDAERNARRGLAPPPSLEPAPAQPADEIRTGKFAGPDQADEQPEPPAGQMRLL
jgi:hypothetical protein